MPHFSKELFTTGSNNIFVFGSNTAGRHGAGAAKFAIDYCGAKYGTGFGLEGNSFGIPTKDDNINTLPLIHIEQFVKQFILFAHQNPQLTFYITAIGTGLAGYTDVQIAPMFADAPPNCVLPSKWKILEKDTILLDKPSS
jgi:hypothetical protein